MKKRTTITAAAVSVALALGVLTPGVARAATCAAPAPGGEWAYDGGDLYGTRSQPAETTISVANALSLAPKWVFSAASQSTNGRFTTVPIVADGCVFLQTSAGSGANAHRLFALNAETGELVWSRILPASGGIASPHAHGGIVYVNVPTNQQTYGKGPHVLGFDAQTGDTVFESEGVCGEPGCANNSGGVSPALFFDDMVWIGITNAEMDGSRVGGFAIVDAKTGQLLKRTYTVPDEQAAAGFGGCAIWAAPAVDPVTKYGYVGTAQPSSWTGKESEYCNAIVKFDLDRTRSTFGEIVGALKGTPDDAPYTDIDFGGSGATLVNDVDGRQIVVQHQKSGWLHAAYTRHMTKAWSTANPGYGYIFGAYTKTASDGKNIFSVGNFGGPMSSVNGSNGMYNWVSPVVAPLTQGSVAYANGLVYFVDEVGVFHAVNASNGVPVYKRPLRQDGNCVWNISSGVSVARNTVYAACGPLLVALHIPTA